MDPFLASPFPSTAQISNHEVLPLGKPCSIESLERPIKSPNLHKGELNKNSLRSSLHQTHTPAPKESPYILHLIEGKKHCAENKPGAQGLNYHRQYLCGSAVSASIPPSKRTNMYCDFEILILS